VRALVIYESEFGSTRAVAEAIGRGLATTAEVRVLDSRQWAEPAGWQSGTDLVVLGVPTHARSLPSPASRQQALDWPHRPGSTLKLERNADAAGVREWLAAQDLGGLYAAAFASRIDMAKLLAGSAAPRLARAIAKAGAVVIGGPQDFLVRKDGRLVEHELDHAYEWGRVLASTIHELAAPGDNL
jgi:hypothetical protein